jgi:hypothetical protein
MPANSLVLNQTNAGMAYSEIRPRFSLTRIRRASMAPKGSCPGVDTCGGKNRWNSAAASTAPFPSSACAK